MSSEVGNRIREERKKLGLSQALFAEKAGIHRNTQANYEAGSRNPDIEYIVTIMKIGVDIGYVLEGYDWFESDKAETPLVGLGISLGRMLDKFDVRPGKAGLMKLGDIDFNLLAEILEGVDLALQQDGLAMSALKKAKATALLYRSFSATGKVDANVLAETIRLAAA
ncbi:MAG: helix-turn-helix transcriptional regulator [Pseudomonadota bacterium]|jgi:transcriptional regulator with XRE-family HTH domain